MRELIITEGRSAMASSIMPQFRSGDGKSNLMRILGIRIKICKWTLKLIDTKNVQKQIKLKRKIAAAKIRLSDQESKMYPKPFKKPRSYKELNDRDNNSYYI